MRADDWTRANTTCFVRTKLLPDVTGRQLPGSPWFWGSMIAGAQSFPVTTRWCLACLAGHARGQRTTHPTRRTHTTARPGPNLAGWRMLWPAGYLVRNLLGAEAAAYAPAARCSMAVASRSTTMRSRGSPETRSLHDRSDCGRCMHVSARQGRETPRVGTRRVIEAPAYSVHTVLCCTYCLPAAAGRDRPTSDLPQTVGQQHVSPQHPAALYSVRRVHTVLSLLHTANGQRLNPGGLGRPAPAAQRF